MSSLYLLYTNGHSYTKDTLRLDMADRLTQLQDTVNQVSSP